MGLLQRSPFLHLASFLTIVFIGTSIACSAQTEPQALESLRQLTRDGKLPAESVVEQIERRFAGRQTGVLARLLRARIKFENKDFAGAATLLDSPDFASKTKLGDYALWLRGQALQASGNHAEALKAIDGLLRNHPDSFRVRDAKLLWASSAIAVGRAVEVPPTLADLVESNDLDAVMATARAFDAQGSRTKALGYYIQVYSFAFGSKLSEDAKTAIARDGSTPAPPDEFSHAGLYPGEEKDALRQARYLYDKGNYQRTVAVYQRIVDEWYGAMLPADHLRRLTSLAKIGRLDDARSAFGQIPNSAGEREEGYRQLVLGYSKNKLWTQARQYAEEMRQKFPNGKLTPKAWVDAGYAARDAKNKGEENYFLQTALTAWPSAVEVAGAQFELAWLEHEAKNFGRASEMMIEHLVRYADKDTTNRGKAGYWAARDAERSGNMAAACDLYHGVVYRYAANWYGYIAKQRIDSMINQGNCGPTGRTGERTAAVAKAVANLKSVTVAPETSGQSELERAEKSEQLSTIGLFDWAIDELNEAKKTAANSPKINLALAKHYKLKGDNVNALLALAKSYPDYAQMFPEEMGREEWEIFYPHVAWDQIAAWAKNRNLDLYQVAGLIRQESVFNPRARSGAQAFGLMQLLLPTARLVARKYGSTANLATADALYQPAVNIELGTGYMRDQLDKFGRIEYMAVAYNAGPGRVAPWRASLPMEMDEFVEAIPFKETKGYVQGVIRNSAQYRRLYDENGNFKPNVGTRPLRGEIDSKPRDQFVAEFPEIIVSDIGPSE